MTPEQFAAVDWANSANWAQLVKDTRQQGAQSSAALTRTQTNTDWLSSWWVTAGAAVNRFNLRKESFLAALNQLADKLGQTPDWLNEAGIMVNTAQLDPLSPDVFNTVSARRVRTAAIGAAYQRLLTAGATVRQGLQTGETRTTAAQLDQEQARSTPDDVRYNFQLMPGGGWPWGLILLFGAAALAAFGGRRG